MEKKKKKKISLGVSGRNKGKTGLKKVEKSVSRPRKFIVYVSSHSLE